MPTPKFPSLLVASLLAASVLAPLPAFAFTPVSELKDLSPDHWAYTAIQALVEKYEVMEGFPDKTFRGPKTLTRYELAAALAKVMAKVEELISTATGQPISVDPGVNPEDLRTIARLQREFRDELEVLKGRVDTLDTRVGVIEKRVRLGGELRTEYRDFLGATPAGTAPIAEFRQRNRLNMDASLSDEIVTHGSLVWDVYGAEQVGNAFAAAPTVGTFPWTDIYVQRAYGSYTPGWLSLHGGLVNASEVLTLGSTLKNPFTTNVWREGTGGFGFVGTPGLNPGATTLTRLNGATAANSNNVWWLPGTDVALQALDPNATQAIFPRSNLTAAASGEAGPFSLGLAVYQPSMAGREPQRLGALGYAASLPQPEMYSQGQRMLATVGGDFGFVRAQIAAKTPGGPTSNPAAFNKTVTGALDLGGDSLGLSLQAVSRTAFTGTFTPTQASATLASNDLFGTGFGLGLGMNAGSVLDTSLATGNNFTLGPTGHSLLQGLGGADYASYGLYLRIPGFSILPNLTLAAQQTAGSGGFSGASLGSGITVQGDLQLFALPKIQLEYSMGKFDPGVDNSLLNSAAPISHEQLTAQLVMPF